MRREVGCSHGPDIEGAVCTRAAGTVSRAHPSETICRILLLFPSLSTTGVSSPPTQRGPPGTNHVSTTVPLGLLPKRHCFLLHTHGLGCEVRIKCGPTETSGPTSWPRSYSNLSLPLGDVRGAFGPGAMEKLSSRGVARLLPRARLLLSQPQSGCARAVMQPLPQGSLRALKGHGASRSHGSREGPKVRDCCTPAPFWRPFW